MRKLRWVTLLAVLLYVPPAAFPQQQPAPPPAVDTPGANPAPPQAPGKKKKNEHKISEKEAKALFAEVDEILKFVSKDTGLEIKHPVKRELASREQVRKYVASKSKDDEDTKKLARTGIVLKKIGLLPRDFDLEAYLSDLLEEQVAGYYDSKTKTVYLLDWIDADSQKPVLAHELTHALQDQNYDLEKFLRKGIKQEDQSKSLKAHEEIEVHVDEPGTARQAIIEGQAMVVLIDYILAPSGHTVADSPMIGEMIKMNAQRQNDEYPLMAKAPLYLRDSLMFPYTYGMDFVEAMLHRGGRQLAFAGVLGKPPRNTREVMEPKAYAMDERLGPLVLPDMHKLLGKEYEPYDVGNVGEFDVHGLLKQFAGEKAADKLSPRWRGGAYYAAERTSGLAGKTDCAAKRSDAKVLEAQRVACLAMLIETRWDSPEAATQFAQRYASLLLVKYRFAQNLSDESAQPEKSDRARTRCFECAGGERFRTDEGLVIIQQQGDLVIALETFDDETTGKLQAAAALGARPPSAVHSPQ
ncbi:MAG: hypothetical protein HYX28_08540 [Candidatus Koribacter versatilis]|uniref:Uncharacterized protein n=1 Tax=Candidatus Korobacter versatilis TaxID=658062 RepID=A0A932A8U0_9BACT|nr:hypothetical protein [Candidatus Koribacter versatilis]